MENCIVTANITSTKGYAGGLIGDISGRGVKINQSAHIGTVTGNAYNVGGMIGRINYKAEVENCYHRGTVANESGNTGGLVGQLNDSVL